MEKPKVSIIVPVYNVENYLNDCVDSILSQTFSEFECILVDDCSTDNSPKICDEYSMKDRRIKVIHNIRNLGSSISRKVGLDNCDGEYIQYIDGDDWIEKDMLEKMWTKAVSSNFDMVVCDCFYEEPDYRIYKRQGIDKMEKIEIIKDIVVMKKLACAVWNKMVKREVVLKIQFPTQNYSEDRFISLQTIYYSQKIGYIEDALYHYRYNINSITRDPKNNDNRTIEFYDIYIQIINFLKEKYGTAITFFEPELVARINSVKMDVFVNRRLRKLRNVGKLYPEANGRFILFCILTLCIKIVKKIYRIVIPEKIRNSIWERKRCVNGGCRT